MNGVLITICIWVLGLFIFYLVIKSAIDNSETAHNIRVIKELLSRQYPIKNADEEAEDTESEISEAISNGEAIDGYCPACQAKIPEDTAECPSCGLSLK